jgi:hypothetical protein
MRRIRVQRPRRRRERPWLEALAVEPQDPDIVRAKALDRSPSRPSRGDSGRDMGRRGRQTLRGLLLGLPVGTSPWKAVA